MVVTGATCEAQIKHALGVGPKGSLSPGISPLQIANEAGEYLCALRGWKWLEGRMVQVDFVSGQDYVELPSDLRAIKAIDTTDGLTTEIELTTLQAVLEYRTKSLSVPLYFFAAISHDAVDGRPTPRLELWPTPTSDTDRSVSIFYTAGWSPLTSGDSVAYMPAWIEALYYQILRAFAHGYEEADDGTVDQRLALVAQGPLMDAAVSRDVTVQPNYGQLTNGIAMRGTFTNNSWRDRTIGAPD